MKILLINAFLSLFYLIVSQRIFASGFINGENNTLSFAFAILIPFAMGALASYTIRTKKKRFGFYFLVPVLVILIGLIVLTLIGLQSRLKGVILMPFMLSAAIFGSLFMRFLTHKTSQTKHTRLYLMILLLFPYIALWPELSFFQRTKNITIHTETEISAPPEVVWNNIICVPEITGQDEQFPEFVLWLGVPKPRAAVLSHEGVGGWRDASFDRGMTFIEKITEWIEGEEISFTIDIDLPGEVEIAKEIDNNLFQIVDATYRIESLGDDKVILHLDSRQRITSSFSSYGEVWTDLIMRSLQEYVMKAIEKRSEKLEQRGETPLQTWCTRTSIPKKS